MFTIHSPDSKLFLIVSYDDRSGNLLQEIVAESKHLALLDTAYLYGNE